MALKTHAPLQTRVGIATGLVVVGDLIGSGASQEQAIVGETPNLAARLQGVAEPNRVVIAESTRKLVGNLFELEDLGAQDLKGIAGPVRAWAALRPSSVEGRFEAFHASGLTELVGREEELELLLRRWSKAKTGEGQVVLLSGEPGIGKSRLTAALLERLATEPHTRLRYFCSPQHTDSALYPIIGQMERAAGFAHDDTRKRSSTSSMRCSQRPPHRARTQTLFAEMLSLPNDGRYPALELAAQQRRQKNAGSPDYATGGTIALQPGADDLRGCALDRPHEPRSARSDGGSHNRRFRVLLIVTYRPEFEPPWVGQSYVSALTSTGSGSAKSPPSSTRVSGNKPLPANIRRKLWSALTAFRCSWRK